MIGTIFNIILRFIVLVLIQVLVLNQVVLHGYITPYIYPLALLLIPIATPKWALLLMGFILGISIDIFSNTGGMHAFATVFLAFILPGVQKLLTPREGYESGDRPTVSSLGFKWFIAYILISIPVHHLVFFTLEVFSFGYLKYLLLKILFSSVATISIILITQYVFYPRRKSSTYQY